MQNIGLQAKILSQRTFTIFVVMALVTTFATTPLTLALYPSWYQKKLGAWKRGEIDWDGNQLSRNSNASDLGDAALEKYHSSEIRKLLVYLRLESLPSLFTFIALLGGSNPGASPSKFHHQKAKEVADPTRNEPALYPPSHKKPLEVHGLRMLELSERQSSVMKESEVDDYSVRDPVVNTFHAFGQLNNVAVSGELQIVPEGSFAEILAESASDRDADMVLLPWSDTGRLSESGNPLLLEPGPSTFSSGPHNQFVTNFLANAPCNAAIFISNGFGALARRESKGVQRVATVHSLRSISERERERPTAPILDRSHHIFFPFFGGADDRVALRFVLRLAQNSDVTATIVNVNLTSDHTDFSPPNVQTSPNAPSAGEPSYDQERAFFTAIQDSLPRELESRVVFSTIQTQRPLHTTLEIAKAEMGLAPQNAGDIVVVGRGIAVVSGQVVRRELEALRPAAGAWVGVEKSLGLVAEGIIGGDVRASVLVVQAGGKGMDI